MARTVEFGDYYAEVQRATELETQLIEAEKTNQKLREDISEAKCVLVERERYYKRLREALGSIKWSSADKDNMEFTATITCYQMDAIRKALECDHLWGTRQGGFLVHCGKCGAIKQMEGE